MRDVLQKKDGWLELHLHDNLCFLVSWVNWITSFEFGTSNNPPNSLSFFIPTYKTYVCRIQRKKRETSAILFRELKPDAEDFEVI